MLFVKTISYIGLCTLSRVYRNNGTIIKVPHFVQAIHFNRDRGITYTLSYLGTFDDEPCFFNKWSPKMCMNNANIYSIYLYKTNKCMHYVTLKQRFGLLLSVCFSTVLMVLILYIA